MFEKLRLNELVLILAVFLSLGLVTEAHAQVQVSGTVSTTDGDPLPGVNIVVQGTTTGTTTDMDGNYQLNVPSTNVTLVFTYIGHQRQEIPLNGRTRLDVQLVELIIEGQELVVTAFGIERQARGLTYSTQGVKTEEFTEARELNVVNSLQGRVAGLNINRSSTGVGGEARVVLRGNRSISGESEPLYIVDGVPIRGGLSDLSPDEIVSVDVLKGANAAALYGAAAQNGAIIVTTRRGEAGQVNVSLSNTFQFENPILTQQYQNEYGQGLGGVYDPHSEFNWGPRMTGQTVAHWSPAPGAPATYALEAQPDNIRDAFQTGWSNASNLTASVGGERTQTVFSYTWTGAEGMIRNNTMDRHNVTVRVTSQLSDKLTLDSRLTYMRRIIENALPTGENFANPVRHIYRIPRNIRTEDMRQFEYTDVNDNNRQHFWNPGSNGGANPYWTMYRNLDESRRERVLTMGSLRYEIMDGLSAMVRAAYDGANGQNETIRYNDSYVIAPNGLYSLSQSNSMEFNTDFLVSFQRDLNPDWSVSANVGGNLQIRRNDSVNASTGSNPGLTIPNFFTISNSQVVQGGHSIGSPRDVQSLYAFGQIGWRDAIYLDLTGRNDWSSTLPSDSRSYFYPSVGLSAVLSDLIPSFPEFFTFARVRASYAQVGSPASPFQLARTLSASRGGRGGFLSLSNTIPAENLKPEQTESYEVGLDVRFFGGRLGLDVTAYQTNTTNQLFTVSLPPGSGASSFYTNGGDVENKGIEILLSTTPVQRMNFVWDLDFNFGLNRNTVVAISEDAPRYLVASDFLRDFYIEEGQPYGQVYSRGWVRDDQGRVLIDPDSGMPLMTGPKSVPVANFQPDWTGSIYSSLSYRNWSLSVLIDHRQGGTIASLTQAILDADGLTKRTLQGREDELIFGQNFFGGETAVLADEDGNPTDVVNNVAIKGGAQAFWMAVGGRNAPVGEAFVESATNTRVRELTLGYSLPQNLLAGLPVSRVNVSLVGRNLFFIHKASKNLDPDMMVGTSRTAEGFDSFTLPTARTFGASVKIDF